MVHERRISKLAVLRRFVTGLLFPHYYLGAISQDEQARLERYRAGDAVDDDEPLRVCAWNIQRNYDPESIYSTLQAIVDDHDPHVFLLQEVPVYRDGPWWELSPFRELFAAHHLYYFPVHQMKRGPCDHQGNLILSRVPFEGWSVLELPTVTRATLGRSHVIRRSSQRVRVRGFDVWNVHLENATLPKGRWKQAAYLSEHLGAHAIVGGDFNTMFSQRFEPCLQEFEGFGPSYHVSEYALRPRLDYIFVRGAAARAVQLVGRGSDHEPVLVRLSRSQRSPRRPG